jgi:hypothetical protein
MFNRNKTLKKAFTEKELVSTLTEMPQRFHDALAFAIEDQIIMLEDNLSANAASDHGSIAQISGGIYYLRHILTELSSKRNLTE